METPGAEIDGGEAVGSGAVHGAVVRDRLLPVPLPAHARPDGTVHVLNETWTAARSKAPPTGPTPATTRPS
ncbi:hypothetical protein OPV22_016840 [Ensete ventricosum]|uniref:FAS1 domain-containing protein n=1 Tax=Ensete ventricosum TaxID=4639 RepID=A0AAV8QSI2_ENSVE|nr:hypothetical protein OPV22_016840 [Ensete ventricosum]